MRLEGRVGVPPKTQAEEPNSTHDGHDNAHQDPNRDGHVLGGLAIFRPKADRAGEGLPGRRTEKEQKRH